MKLIVLVLATLIFSSTFGQDLDTLKLVETEVPGHYKAPEKMLYQSIQPGTFYTQTGVYETLIGKSEIRTSNLMKARPIVARLLL